MGRGASEGQVTQALATSKGQDLYLRAYRASFVKRYQLARRRGMSESVACSMGHEYAAFRAMQLTGLARDGAAREMPRA